MRSDFFCLVFIFYLVGVFNLHQFVFINVYLILISLLRLIFETDEKNKVENLQNQLTELHQKLNLHWRIDDVSEFKESFKSVKRERF